MKKKLVFLLICFIIFINYASAQSGWFDVVTHVSDDLHSIFFLNNLTGYVSGNSGRILKTSDGGASWDSLQTLNYSHNIYGICFVNSVTGFAVGSYCLYKTTNSGLNWTFSSIFNDLYAYDIAFANENTGFVVGYYKMAKTTNSGNSWIVIPYEDNYLSDITFINSNVGYILSDITINCRILKTTDSGSNWFISSEINCFAGITIYPVNESNLYVIGGECYQNNFGPMLYRTSNGGNSWIATDLGEYPYTYKGLYFINEYTGFISGDFGFILKTTNSGVNWYNQTIGQGGPILNAIKFVNDSAGIAVGGNGKIKRTLNGGGPIAIYQIGSLIPTKFNLFQNYPNPFNPVTKIKFCIPSPYKELVQNVKLVIYDILGREASTLVNEPLQPGVYETEFDGTNYASGIYFCRISSTNFSQSIKMILVK